MTFREFRSAVCTDVKHLTVYGVCRLGNENVPVLIETENPYDDRFMGLYDCNVVCIKATKKNHFEVNITNL